MTDVNQLITDHLDTWTAATAKKSSAGRGTSGSISLYGIKKLRELILELAVRGKLVPQEGSVDEGRNLLSCIKRLQQQFYQNKSIKKPKILPEPSHADLNYEVPKGWAIARLNDLGDWGAGATPSRKSSGLYGGDIPWFKSGELTADLINVSEETVTQEALKKSSLRLNQPGDVLVAMYGATIGKTAIVAVEATTNQAVCACTPFEGFLNQYLLLLLKAYRGRLVGMGAGGAQPNISREKIIATVVALPPTTEQQRIVAKVDELMALCDALERQAEDSLEAHQTLVETCLATLTNSQSPEDLTQNWTRIAANFDTLITTEESLVELNKTVLQLGMMGLLVEQDSSTSNAILLESASRMRTTLVAKKEAKAFKAKEIDELVEKPFDLPRGWSWLRLGEATSLITKGSSPKWQGVSYTDDPTEVMFVTSENVGRFEMLLDTPKYVERKFNTVEPRSILQAGDYLMNIVGASIGRTAIYPGPDGANINQAVCLIRVLPGLFDPRFLIAFFNSEFCRGYMFDKQVENARANLSMGNISQFLIPVPPIEEQRAVAEKIKILSGLSSNLSRQLQSSSMISKSLADTLTSKIH